MVRLDLATRAPLTAVHVKSASASVAWDGPWTGRLCTRRCGHRICRTWDLPRRQSRETVLWLVYYVHVGAATESVAREICLGVCCVRRSFDWSTMYTSVRPQILSHVKSASSSVSRKLIAGVPSQPPCADSYRVCCHESRTKWKAFPVQKLEAVLILGLKN